jgi:hypothetical protein
MSTMLSRWHSSMPQMLSPRGSNGCTVGTYASLSICLCIPVDYVCLRCHLLMHICFCFWFLMFAYDIYTRLCMFICLLTGYDISEGKFCWNYAVWRKGKWVVGILVLKLDTGICVYKGTCPPTVLSFFLSSSRNVLYYFPIHHLSNTSLSPPTELRSLRFRRP